MNRRLRPYLCAFALALLALTIQLPMLHSTAFAQTVDKESFEFEVTDNVTQVSPPVTVEVADSGADDLISAQPQVHVVLNVALGKETSGKVAFSATAHSPRGLSLQVYADRISSLIWIRERVLEVHSASATPQKGSLLLTGRQFLMRMLVIAIELPIPSPLT